MRARACVYVMNAAANVIAAAVVNVIVVDYKGTHSIVHNLCCFFLLAASKNCDM